MFYLLINKLNMSEDMRNFGIVFILLAFASLVGVWSAGGCTSKTGNQTVELHVDRIEDNVVTLSKTDTLNGIITTYTYVTDIDYVFAYDVSTGLAKTKRRFLDRIAMDRKLVEK